MRKPQSVDALETLGRVRLSKLFFMRDFLYSEIANHYGIPNIPNDPDLAIEAGKHLCEELLEPLQATFGRIAIRSAYRSRAVNDLGNMTFFAKLGAFNLGWHEAPRRSIDSFAAPKGKLIADGLPPNHEFARHYQGWPTLQAAQ